MPNDRKYTGLLGSIRGESSPRTIDRNCINKWIVKDAVQYTLRNGNFFLKDSNIQLRGVQQRLHRQGVHSAAFNETPRRAVGALSAGWITGAFASRAATLEVVHMARYENPPPGSVQDWLSS